MATAFRQDRHPLVPFSERLSQVFLTFKMQHKVQLKDIIHTSKCTEIIFSQKKIYIVPSSLTSNTLIAHPNAMNYL